MDPADQVRLLADRVRAIAEQGLEWSADAPYDRERYERLHRTAAELFATVDVRPADEIERTLFTALTHRAPVPCADAGVVDDHGRVLLIRRADNGLWALPGGMLEMGETPAEGAAREAAEEAGVVVEVRELVGVFDSRLTGSLSPLQLYAFVFLCRPVDTIEPATPDEVIDIGWFDGGALPDLSPGHQAKVPTVLRFLEERRTWFDPLR